MNNNTEVSLGFLASRVLDAPLMITQTKLNQILDVVGGRIGLNRTVVVQPGLEAVGPSAARGSNINVSRGVAHIPIFGTLVHRTQGLQVLSGLTSYTSIRSQFNEALNSPDVESILLEVDSTGGEVAGVFDLVDTIYNARGTKPIVAIINERGYSAAYALASAADSIYLTRTAGGGSIGVIMLHVDRSEANKKAGVTYTPIYAGDRKINGSPHAPLSDDARSDAQATVDSMYNLFVSTVARNTGLSESVIRNTQAGTYHGQSAVDIGLANAVLPYQEVLTQLINKKGGTRLIMTREEQEAKDQAAKKTAEKEKAEADAKVVAPVAASALAPPNSPTVTDPQPTVDPPQAPVTQEQPTEATTEAMTASERERCISIIEACAVADTPSLALTMINNGSTLEITHAAIMAVLAGRSKASSVTSAVNPTHSGETNPLLADAKRRAEAAKKH